MSYDAKDIRLWADIEGIGELEVVRFGADLELNVIPSAILVVALGRRGDTGVASQIHHDADLLRQKQKIKVYLEVTQRGLLNKLLGLIGLTDLPAKTTLFDGYTAGVGYRRTSSGAEYTIALEHWLADLNFSSAVSRLIHPLNPSDASASALAGVLFGSGGVAGDGTGIGILTPEAVMSDLWGDAILKWFEKLSDTDHLSDPQAAGPLAQLELALGAGGKNHQALAALGRMEPNGGGYRSAKALRFDTTGHDAAVIELIAQNIQEEVSAETLSGVAAQTLWDVLLRLGASYMFSVVPLLDKAIVVPTMPVYRTAWRKIFASEYEAGETSGDTPRLLRAIALASGKLGEAGSIWGDGQAVDFSEIGLGGFYTPPNLTTGQVLLKVAPPWMRNNVAGSLGKITENIDAAYLRRNAADPQRQPDVNLPQPADALPKLELALDRFAESLYGVEVLRHRVGWLSGKLRLDIAPGSVVEIERAAERFLGLDDKLGDSLFALVTRVEISIDAEAGQCGTRFQLAHCRTAGENALPGISTDRHPLWLNAFPGCSLL